MIAQWTVTTKGGSCNPTSEEHFIRLGQAIIAKIIKFSNNYWFYIDNISQKRKSFKNIDNARKYAEKNAKSNLKKALAELKVQRI